jgi:hypothetical protein
MKTIKHQIPIHSSHFRSNAQITSSQCMGLKTRKPVSNTAFYETWRTCWGSYVSRRKHKTQTHRIIHLPVVPHKAVAEVSE